MVVERARAGLASARARDRNGGQPFKTIPDTLRLVQDAMDQKETKVSELCAELGVSRQTLYRHVDPEGALWADGEKHFDRTGQHAWLSRPAPDPETVVGR